MQRSKMNEVLAEMQPHEMREALWMIDVFERAGGLRQDEAIELRWRVIAWLWFYGLDQTNSLTH